MQMRRIKQNDDASNSKSVSKLEMLKSLVRSLPSSPSVRSDVRNRARRLSDLEAAVTKITVHAARRFCSCRAITVVLDADVFERQLGGACPLHGFRNLGALVKVSCTEPDESDKRIEQLESIYFEKLRKHLLGGTGGIK
jgi:hypothetical protein